MNIEFLNHKNIQRHIELTCHNLIALIHQCGGQCLAVGQHLSLVGLELWG